jgi:hypothetical protein
MIRKTGIALISLMILWSGTAFGALEALEEVAELAVSGIRLPTSAAGQVVYRKCGGCEPTIWQVDAATTYHVGVGSAPAPLADLRQAVGSNQYELIYVFYAPDTGTVTRIVLSLS